MALNLVTGPSGSGKTHSLFSYALKQAEEHIDYNYLIVVPEQYTLSTQKELVRMSKNKGILNVDVLSFARLSYRLFEEIGFSGASGIVMDDMGKNLILRHLANENREKLSYFAGKINKLSYITELKSVISEFKQYRISSEDIEKMIESAEKEGKNNLSKKLLDVKTLYQLFNEYISDKYTTSEEILELAAREAYKSEKLKKSVVIFDGFTGFTPVQYMLIESLLLITQDIYVSLISDERDGLLYNREYELFYLSYETKNKLSKLAENNNICIKNTLSLNEDIPYRYDANKKRLIHLEKNLFREYKKTFESENNISNGQNKPTKVVNDEIRIISALNPIEEVKNVAVTIKKYVEENGYRYRDIAIALGDMQTYTPVIISEFKKYGIPVFTDKKNPVLLNPFTEYVRSLIEIVTSDWRYEAVFRFLRTGLNDYKTDDIDSLENFVLKNGVKGFDQWNCDWTKKYIRDSKKMSQYEIDYINNIENLRKYIIDEISIVNKLQTNDDNNSKKIQTKSVNELNADLYGIFDILDIQNRLYRLAENIKITDDIFASERANEFGRVFKQTIELMEKMRDLLGDEKITIEEYGDLLDAGFDEIRIGIIPPVTDYIQIGDITRSRFENIHALFIVGANEGVIPQNGNGGGIISDIEKEFIISYTPDIELSPSSRMKTYTNQLYLYMLMTKPDRNLVLSYSRLNMASESMKPSYIIGVLENLFPDLLIERNLFEKEDYIYNEETAMEYLSSSILSSELADIFLSYFADKEKYKDRIGKIIASYLNEGVLSKSDSISKAVANVLYTSSLKSSVTRLERFAECAYKYFLEYGVQLKDRELFDFDVKDMGNLFHKALENYSELVTKNGTDWTDLDEKQRAGFVDTAIENALESGEYTAVYSNFRKKYVITRVKRILDRSVSVLTDHLRVGKLKPIDAEIEFSSTTNLKAFNFMLSETERMHLTGKIDRIDTYEDGEHVYIKIIDYKSGNKSFDLLEVYKGLSLQLVVYLNAAKEMISAKTEKEVVPAGILYYHIDDPIVESENNDSDEEIANKIYAKLKMKGLVNESEDVYKLIDGEFEKKSDIIPIQINKNGSLGSYSSAVSTEEFNVISSFVEKKLCDIGKEILSGKIEAKPNSVRGIDDSKCKYCSYVTVCKYRFSEVENDDNSTFEKTIDSDEVIELMKRELGIDESNN